MNDERLVAFERLLNIMDDLRAKCPWDKKQTMQSLRHLTIEETYELGDAILSNDLQEVKKELGDLLLHIVFYAKIGSETNSFNIADVANGVCEKLIERHPHIYGDVQVNNEEDVKRNWEKIKLKEGNKSVLGGVPKSLPALVKATRIQDKAAGVHAEVKAQKQSNIESEFGDVLFSLINYARFLKVNPEDALERTNRKFIARFQYLEEKATAQGKSLKDMTLQEMETYWQEAKNL